MHHRERVLIIAGVGLLLTAGRSAADGKSPIGLENDKTFARAMSAEAENAGNLHSGRGTAHWQAWRDGKQWIDAQMEVAFQGDRYNALIRYTRLPDSPRVFDPRRHIICDEKVIVHTNFSPDIRPGGCQAERRESNIDGFIAATGGLQLVFPKLRTPVFGPKADLSSYQFLSKEELPTGDVSYRLRGTRGSAADTEVSYVISPQTGFHVIKSEFFIKDSFRCMERQFQWKRHDNAWWPAKVEIKTWYPAASKSPPDRLVLEWDQFEANVEREDKLFTISALERCHPMRLIDRRPGIPQGQRVRELPPENP